MSYSSCARSHQATFSVDTRRRRAARLPHMPRMPRLPRGGRRRGYERGLSREEDADAASDDDEDDEEERRCVVQ